MTTRIIDYKKHDGLPGNWRATKVRYGAYSLEVELPCINGLAAWFTVAVIHEAEDAERLMTDGAHLEAKDYAERFAAAPAALRALADRVRALEAALRALVNAADDVGVRHFDTDTMSPEVETMQTATLNARAALQDAGK